MCLSIHEWHCLKSSFWKALTGKQGNNKLKRQVESKQLLISRSAGRGTSIVKIQKWVGVLIGPKLMVFKAP